jgi:hypothetical protein
MPIGVKYHVVLTFTEEVLGTVTKDKAVYASYIQSKAPPDQSTDDELETVEEIEQRGWTGFHMEGGQPLLYDYAIKGFFKDAVSMLKRVDVGDPPLSKKLTAHKKIIDGLVFVRPRRIPLLLPDGVGLGVNERPLRAQTAQGERVALARSDTCPPGTVCAFDVQVLGQVTQEMLTEWLEYGALHGLGQWRSGGHGTFDFTVEKTA